MASKKSHKKFTIQDTSEEDCFYAMIVLSGSLVFP